MLCHGTEHLCCSPGMGIAGKAVFSSQKHSPKPWQVPSVLIWVPAQCHLRISPLHQLLGKTCFRQEDWCSVWWRSPPCFAGYPPSLSSTAGIAPDSKEGTSNPWEQGKNVAWNRLVWIKLIPSYLPFHFQVENPLGLWQARIVSPSPAYMGHFKINQQGSISWKDKEMFQSVSLQTDLLLPGSAYFKKCFRLFGAVY